MKDKKPWFENNRLWEAMTAFLFGFDRWDAAVKEIDNLIKTLSLQPNAHILDLCCGPGRHSIDLSRRGFKVTGVDRTAHYLDIAKDKAAWESLDIEFVQEDMLRFRRQDTYDAAISMYTSFGYFESIEDDREVAKNIFHSLKPGGQFVIDTLGKEVFSRIYRPRDWGEEAGTLFLEERTLAPDWSYVTMRWILIKDDSREEFELKLRMFSAQELSELLKSCGFSKVDIYGNFDGTPYDHQARRLVTVAQK